MLCKLIKKNLDYECKRDSICESMIVIINSHFEFKGHTFMKTALLLYLSYET